MNYGIKKSIIKVCKIISLLVIIYTCLEQALNLILPKTAEQTLNLFGMDLTIIRPIRFLITTLLFCLLYIFLYKKQNQTKEEFYSSIKSFKVISIISILLNISVGILLIFVAFTKDDEKPEISQAVAKKSTLSKQDKQKMRELKIQKRRGIISKENYEKQINKINKQS